MPPAITGPAPLIVPPFALTPFTVLNSCAVLYSHKILPSLVENASIVPPRVPEKTAPGMTLTGADCAGLQSALKVLQFAAGGRECQTNSPVASWTALRPPAFSPRRASATGK